MPSAAITVALPKPRPRSVSTDTLATLGSSVCATRMTTWEYASRGSSVAMSQQPPGATLYAATTPIPPPSATEKSYPHSALFSRIVLLLCENWCYGKPRRPVLDHRPRGGRVTAPAGPTTRPSPTTTWSTCRRPPRPTNATWTRSKPPPPGNWPAAPAANWATPAWPPGKASAAPRRCCNPSPAPPDARPTNWSPWAASPTRPAPPRSSSTTGSTTSAANRSCCPGRPRSPAP